MLKILIAEDENLEIQYLEKALSQNPDYHLVCTATNGQIAMDYITKNPVDLAIIDIRMPLLDGISLTKIIKKKYPHIKVIINTAYAEFELAQAALRSGADEYLVKPAKAYLINSTIKNLMVHNQGSPNSSTASSVKYNLKNYPLKEERTLINALLNYDIELIKLSFDDFVDSLFLLSDNKEAVIACSQDFISEIAKTLFALGLNLNEISNFKSRYTEKVSSVTHPWELSRILGAMKEQILALICENNPLSEYKIETILKYIENHYHEEISLKIISRQFHFSESYLSRCIKEHLNTSLPQYINNLRITKAKILLKNSEMKIASIAYRVGYQDISHFNRIFKNATGMTPSSYRKM